MFMYVYVCIVVHVCVFVCVYKPQNSGFVIQVNNIINIIKSIVLTKL